jgi:hypothetical protein
MKNFVQIAAIVAFILIFAASCGNNEEVVKVEETPTYCHTELVSTPLETSVIANEMVIRTGQSISGLVKDHQKRFSAYSKDMFLADNPQIAQRTPYTKLDPCDSSKVKYVSIPVYAGDIVYMRYPNRIDTVPGEGTSVAWKAGTGRLRHVLDMDDKGWFVVQNNPFFCDNRTIVPPTDKEEIILPPHSGDSSSSSDWWSNPSNWLLWLILILLLAGFAVLYLQNHNQYNSTRTFTASQHRQTQDVIVNDGQETRTRVEKSMKDLGSELSQAITAEGKADREMLERQLDAERKSQKETLAAFMKSIRENGGLSGGKKKEE